MEEEKKEFYIPPENCKIRFLDPGETEMRFRFEPFLLVPTSHDYDGKFKLTLIKSREKK